MTKTSQPISEELVAKLIELTEKEVGIHSKILFGESADGGLIAKVNASITTVSDQKILIEKLTDNCQKLLTTVELQAEITKFNRDSIKTINRVLYSLAGVVVFILLLFGAVGFKIIPSLLATIGL